MAGKIDHFLIRIFHRKVFLLLCLIASQILFSQVEPEDEIYRKLQVKYDSIVTFMADFEQTNFWKELDIQKKSNGKIFYNETNLLLDYADPEGQKMLIDSSKVIIFDAASSQALISDKLDIKLRPAEFISLYWKDSKKEIVEQNDKQTKIMITTALQEKIEAAITDDLITEIVYYDKDENFVKYRFLNEKCNCNLPENIFDFRLPEDVNLIDNRRQKK